MRTEIIDVCKDCDFCDLDFEFCKNLEKYIRDLNGDECMTLRHIFRGYNHETKRK